MAYTVFRLNHVHPDPSNGSEMSDRYRAALDMVEFLDQRGLNAVQFDEHHVSSTGWSPTPMMSAGMVLARTEKVLCMIGALLLPLHDPIRVAEDLAVLAAADGTTPLHAVAAGATALKAAAGSSGGDGSGALRCATAILDAIAASDAAAAAAAEQQREGRGGAVQLSRRGDGVDARKPDGCTALWLCARGGSVELLQLLLRRGASCTLALRDGS